MRWHVILAAMLAFILVIGMIAFLVNVINYHIVTNQADRTLSYIMKLESEHPGEQAAGPGQPKPFTALPDLEANYMTRFFIVRFDGNGNVTSTYMDYIAAIYDMYRYLEADASLYNYAKISVNGEYWSVYLALEAVKESFMLRNYGTQDGELYKPDSMEMGGENAGISSPSMPDKIRQILTSRILLFQNLRVRHRQTAQACQPHKTAVPGQCFFRRRRKSRQSRH